MNDSKLGQNQESIQASNKALLLELIREEGNCSRAFLAKKTGLQPTTVTYIINDFIKCGLVEETGLIAGSRGRRSIGIKITDKKYAVLSIRLARTGFCVGTFTLSGKPIKIEEHSYANGASVEDLINMVTEKALAIKKATKGYQVMNAGIAVPGPYNYIEGRILLMTGSVDWSNINLPQTFSEKLSMNVVCIHDASAGALYENWNNPSKGRNNAILYVSVGQGVGGGLLYSGKSMNGSRGYAGEIGHMTIEKDGIPCQCGNRGCLERYTSSLSLEGFISKKKGREVSFKEFKDLLSHGDKDAIECFDDVCDAMATGMVNVFNCFDPEKIIFGDEVSKILPDKFLEKVKAGMSKRILPSLLGNLDMMVVADDVNAELYGAGVAAIQEIYSNYQHYF